MKKITIYHNPRCSKSRQSLEILNNHANVEITEIRYLDTPPDIATLDKLCLAMDKQPLEIIRTGEKLFKELGLNKNDERTRDEWLQIMVSNPKLIERPIVSDGEKTVMGRPPENVNQLF